MAPVFIDTNIPMYAAGASHPLKKPSQRVILAIATGRIDAVTDAEVFQEILYRYIHIKEPKKGFQVFDHFHRIMMGRILPIEALDMLKARKLAAQYPFLSPRDLIHLAVMNHHGIKEIVSTDKGFDNVPDIQRIPPSGF